MDEEKVWAAAAAVALGAGEEDDGEELYVFDAIVPCRLLKRKRGSLDEEEDDLMKPLSKRASIPARSCDQRCQGMKSLKRKREDESGGRAPDVQELEPIRPPLIHCRPARKLVIKLQSFSVLSTS